MHEVKKLERNDADQRYQCQTNREKKQFKRQQSQLLLPTIVTRWVMGTGSLKTKMIMR